LWALLLPDFNSNSNSDPPVPFHDEELATTPDARYIVQRLIDREDQLCALVNRAEGICTALPLPSEYTNSRVFYYEEWTHGPFGNVDFKATWHTNLKASRDAAAQNAWAQIPLALRQNRLHLVLDRFFVKKDLLDESGIMELVHLAQVRKGERKTHTLFHA
jgi:hypothetical protein